jgi:aminodeoxyfutalosine deaminase
MPESSGSTIADTLRAMPKVELHCHLEGSMSPRTVGLLAQRHGADTSEIWPGGLPEKFSFDGFPDFARQFFFGLRVIRTAEDLQTAVVALGADLAANNVRYGEITSTVYTHLTGGMSPADYGTALTLGRRQVLADFGVELSWVIDIPRDLEMPDSMMTVEFLESKHVPDGVVAIGLGGYEVGFPPEPYARQFARAMALGLKSVPHAGETEGASSVKGSLDRLGAHRIGHGVRCLEDPEVVAMLRDSGTMLEVCPTSNLLLHVVESMEDHALPALREAGLRVCINSDDPGMFATDMTTEFVIAHEQLGVSIDDLRAMQRDALDASFASPAVRRRLDAELAASR